MIKISVDIDRYRGTIIEAAFVKYLETKCGTVDCKDCAFYVLCENDNW